VSLDRISFLVFLFAVYGSVKFKIAPISNYRSPLTSKLLSKFSLAARGNRNYFHCVVFGFLKIYYQTCVV